METFAYFHSQNSPGAWLQDQKQYLLNSDNLTGKTSQSACGGKNLMIKLCFSVYPEVVFIQRLSFIIFLHLFWTCPQFSWGSFFPVSLTIIAEGIDGATSEGINYLLVAEDFQPNWVKTKGQETRLCFRVTDCSSVSFWALWVSLLAQYLFMELWYFLPFFHNPVGWVLFLKFHFLYIHAT